MTLSRKLSVQSVFKATESNDWDMAAIAQSETRIFLLYCTWSEVSKLMERAKAFGLHSPKYLWLVTQSVVGDPQDKSINRRALPIGMLGK